MIAITGANLVRRKMKGRRSHMYRIGNFTDNDDVNIIDGRGGAHS